MTNQASELFTASAAVTTASTTYVDGILRVKGFASVETIDRGKDFVAATEFNIASFMSKPTLMYNHKFWNDDNGNEIAIGTIEEMFVGELQLGDDPENYVVFDSLTQEKKNYFPKNKAPDLRPGSKGLWVVAKVSVPAVVEMVLRGDINAFSWRGLSKVEVKMLPGGQAQRVITDVDLFEVSLVNIPANGQSTLAIAKSGQYEYSSVDGYTVHSLRMNRGTFSDVNLVSKYLAEHRLVSDIIKSDDSSYFSVQKSLCEFTPDSLISLHLDEGVDVVAGKLKPSKAPRGWQAEVFQTSKSCESSAINKKETQEMAAKINRKKSVDEIVTQDEAVVEITVKDPDEVVKEPDANATPNVVVESGEDIAVPQETQDTDKASAVAEAPKMPAELQAFVEFLSKSTAATIEQTIKSTLSPALSELSVSLGTMNQSIILLHEKMVKVNSADNIDENNKKKSDTEVTAKAEQPVAMTNALEILQNQMQAIAKSFTDTVRDENVEKKVVSKTNPNACFDTLWPFLSN